MLYGEDEKVIYWFGLAEEGSQAYDFKSFEQFINAKVFHDKNIKGIGIAYLAAHIFDFTINLLIVVFGELQMQYHQIIYREVFYV